MGLHCAPRLGAYTTTTCANEKRAHHTPGGSSSSVHASRSKERARSDSRRQWARNSHDTEWHCTTVSRCDWRRALDLCTSPPSGRDATTAGYAKCELPISVDEVNAWDVLRGLARTKAAAALARSHTWEPECIVPQ
ncbi:hypothetical protein HPB50_004457 [Hyalomma asiaticum]|uniref:Uncharacterized protein n=1 Tax=Hyalomma asiaticum TaxID=266040 RepID=A0ACB7TCM4_HYAAI|nr:hypothetical protein HPB50_004457 [Hyalomma asiaticum]